MKILILSSLAFISVIMYAHAATITLKDGRTVTGDIMHQDGAKVLVKEGDFLLTYYRDEIKSIYDPVLNEKSKLIEKFMAMNPTADMVSGWVRHYRLPKNQAFFLSTENGHIQELTAIRRQILMQDFSPTALKAAIVFLSSPEGKEFENDLKQYHNDLDSKFYSKIIMIAHEAIKQE